MPQPVPSPGAKPRRGILSRPACAIQIAAILSEWAYVEDILTLMFSAATGSHTLEPDGAASINRNWTALVTMKELDSVHMRLRIVGKTLVPQLSPELQERWKALEKELRARARERNLVAHASWSFLDAFPADVILEDESGRSLRYSESDLVAILDRLSAAYVATHDFMLAVLAAQRANHEGRSA